MLIVDMSFKVHADLISVLKLIGDILNIQEDANKYYSYDS